MPHPNLKAFKRIAALLLAGFLTSILIAWTIELASAYQSPWGDRYSPQFTWFRRPDPYHQDKLIIVAHRRYFGTREWMIDRPIGAEVSAAAVPDSSPLAPPQPWWGPIPLTPSWVPEIGPQDGAGTGAIARGFPFLCLETHYQATTTPVGSGALTKDVQYSASWDLQSADHKFQAHLPLRPIPRGLLAATLCYAALFSIPWTLGASLRVAYRFRARQRLRRGHCPSCGYDLCNDFTQPCPECGQPASR